MQVVYRSTIGLQRKYNEDAVALPNSVSDDLVESHGRLYLLADGLGGHPGGGAASYLSVRYLIDNYYRLPQVEDAAKELELIMRDCNQFLNKVSSDVDRLHTMGTTLVAALFREDTLHVLHTGDSRLYILRDSQLVQLTEDQSPLWELYKNGEITKDEIRTNPLKNVISSALGLFPDATISTSQHTLEANSVYMLCSDGLSDMISDSDMERILRIEEPLKIRADKLIALAEQAGGTDNISLILLTTP